MNISRLAGAVAAAALLAGPVGASERPLTPFGVSVEARAGDPPMDSYGLGLNTSVIQVAEWQELQSGITWLQTAPGYLNVTAVNYVPGLYAPLKFDNGVEITQVCARVLDTSSTEQVVLYVGAFESASVGALPAIAILETVTTGQFAAPGYTLLCATVDPVLRIRTDANIDGNSTTSTAQFWVAAELPVGTSTAIGPAIVTWRRTVSPAPGTATFGDVPASHPFFRFVQALAASGVTGGCGGGNYCPDTPVTRGQMAVFLSGALGLYWQN